MPIIVVPATPTAIINMYNVKDFLGSNVFNTCEYYRQKGESKPSRIQLTRDKNVLLPNFPTTFEIVDTTDRFTKDDWARVVAVILTGQEWQFKYFKWADPTVLFQHGQSLLFIELFVMNISLAFPLTFLK